MNHLLVVELPGGSDGDVLARALADGHRFSFLTADPGHYQGRAELQPLLARAERIIDAGSFARDELHPRLQALHRADPFDAILCLQDHRIVESAWLARDLGLRHLHPAVAALARDKLAIRRHLAAAGIAQPAALAAPTPATLLAAAAEIGLPAIVKPIDGFGSQHIFALRTPADLELLRQMPELVATAPGSYGLGLAATGSMLVERLLEGQVIGCDTVTAAGRHQLLGVHEKLFFPPPSFAIRGGSFSTNHGQFGAIEAHAFALLDALGFDHGAAHIELMLTASGPQLIELNPRLVGARLARLLDLARGRSTHADLIRLHTTGVLPEPLSTHRHAVSRWLVAPRAGVLGQVALPGWAAARGVELTLHATAGSRVGPAFDNADRLGCVMVCGADRAEAEAIAEAAVAEASIELLATP